MKSRRFATSSTRAYVKVLAAKVAEWVGSGLMAGLRVVLETTGDGCTPYCSALKDRFMIHAHNATLPYP
ncbi:hypothetical protein IG631_09132 [Alternaria alternata]|nr:hypothetical protein IG631_09132 [Alternaria alternata]